MMTDRIKETIKFKTELVKILISGLLAIGAGILTLILNDFPKHEGAKIVFLAGGLLIVLTLIPVIVTQTFLIYKLLKS